MSKGIAERGPDSGTNSRRKTEKMLREMSVTRCENLKNTYGKISVCGCSKKHRAESFSSNASELSSQRAHKSSKRGRKVSATMAVHDGSKRDFDANDKISPEDASTGSVEDQSGNFDVNASHCDFGLSESGSRKWPTRDIVGVRYGASYQKKLHHVLEQIT